MATLQRVPTATGPQIVGDAIWRMAALFKQQMEMAYALIHGAFGLPRLDLLGAGIATTCVSVSMCVAAIWICYTRRPFKRYRVLGRFWRPDLVLMRQLIVIGVPIAYRIYREAHEDDQPIRDADLLADLEHGDAASKMTEAEFRRVRDRLIGSKKQNKELTED